MYNKYARQDAETTEALHEALAQVKIEAEAEYYADRIRRILTEEEEAKPVAQLSPEEYKMLEYRRKSERLNHVKPDDLDALIDLALDTKDYNWVRKLQKQQELLGRVN